MSLNLPTPKLFAIENSNRDFSKKESWGKNQFNNAFPASLACYMYHKELDPVYITLDENLKTVHKKINVMDLFGIDPLSKSLYFAFERDYVHYQPLMIGSTESVDLVTIDLSTNNCLSGIEIKLTALPDNTTCELTEDKYGCELVVRPPTIVYLALSIATTFTSEELLKQLGNTCENIEDWSEIEHVLPYIPSMVDNLDNLLKTKIGEEKPIVMQPVWKTLGKSPQLNDNCLDIFVWGDFAFTRLFVDITKTNIRMGLKSITRPVRTLVWLIKMLYDIAKNGSMDFKSIIDRLTYNTKNDKAFAVSGMVTHLFMKSEELTNPRIKKDEIKNIILNRGEDFLSPERRFDAVIKNTPGLF